jgi:putative hydrolase of the HAD superfamily
MQTKKTYSNIKVIGFDADDTLWENEPFYRETEAEFCKLLSTHHPEDYVNEQLLETELNNLELYGYGAKGFVLSLIETALRITDNKLEPAIISKTLGLGKQLLNKSVVLLDGVEETLQYLSSKDYTLIVATKGDLLDQERKLRKSNLSKYFHHIEVMSDKTPESYLSLLSHLEIKPSEFVMVGNSLRSDILPPLDIGSQAIHIPFHTTWIHESVSENEIKDKTILSLHTINELCDLF